MPDNSRFTPPRLFALLAAALLPLAVGCGDDPLSARRPVEREPALASHVALPAVRSLALSRGHEGGTLTLRFDHDAGALELPLEPSPQKGRSWTFQVALDLDRDSRTGDASGAERAIALVAPDRAAWLALDSRGWHRVAESTVARRGAEIRVAVPPGQIESGSRARAALERYVVTASDGTGRIEVVPVARTAFGSLDDHERAIPRLQWMRASVRGDSLVLRAQLLQAGRDAPYAPGAPGGWMLQVFLNTDERDTGYWRGYDYIVRGGEWSDGRFVVRLIQPGDQWPGGWGPQSGSAQFDPRTRSFTVTVPRSALGGDDGRVAYGLEFYETVACPECPGGYSHTYFDHWFGATDDAPGRGTVRPAGELERGVPRYGIAPPPSATDAYHQR